MSDYPDKASRYLAQLCDARCNGLWQIIPELARKVDKHAPNRKCLTIAARAGILLHASPSPEAWQQAEQQYGAAIADAMQSETSNSDDLVDGAAVLAAIYYGLGKTELALEQVPEPLHRRSPPSLGTGPEAWAAVSVLQGTLIRGLSFESQNDDSGATNTYRSIIGYLSHIVRLSTLCFALRQAAEELTTHICLYFATGTDNRAASVGEAMAAFHVLNILLKGHSGKFSAMRGTFTNNTPRQFWRTYYTAFSSIVKQGLVYHPSPLHRDHESLEHKGLLEDDDFVAARKQQRTDLRHVEKSYELVLLQEARFPKANESNQEVRNWVELVIGNWKVLCGPTWTDEELGEGGKEAVGRNTLNILYRAQLKTFHSTQILRHLFNVHAYLAEFDLAFKAFDSYIEILTKGNARAKKSGSAGLDLDDADTAMRLAAEAIRVSCRFGSEAAAKKATSIGTMMQKWIDDGSPDTAVVHEPLTKHRAITQGDNAKDTSFSDRVLADAYRSMGVSQACWSRYTYDPVLRKSFQEKAIQSLRQALQLLHDGPDCAETCYALGTVLAETRQIPEAIDTVKHGLRPTEISVNATTTNNTMSRIDEAAESGPAHEADEIGLIPLRHLLGLLLSAAEDYEGAAQSFEDASDKAVPSKRFSAYGASTFGAQSSTAFSHLEAYDKFNAVELKMSQITVTGVVDGAEKAVNASNELIAMYSQFFGPMKLRQPAEVITHPTPAPPKSSAGTVRSFFSRNKGQRKSVLSMQGSGSQLLYSYPNTAAPSAAQTTYPSRPGTAQPPTIHVTGENGTAPMPLVPQNQSGKPSMDESRSGEMTPRKSNSIKGMSILKRKKSANAVTENGISENGQVSDENGSLPNGSNTQVNGAQELGEVNHNLPGDQVDPPIGHTHQPSKQDTRLPGPSPRAEHHAPVPQFVYLQERRLQSTLLIKVWLFIARLYTVANLFNDAQEAVSEARHLVEGLELEVAQEESSVKNFQDRGWGGGKSVEDLWADVYAERGMLLQAQSLPHDALYNFDQALTHSMNHAQATIGLSTILLDMYAQRIPSEKPKATFESPSPAHTSLLPSTSPSHLAAAAQQQQAQHRAGAALEPLALYRLAARDRAYGLLASLTRLAHGYDLSDAWLALARAHEESGQVTEAKEALWRVVELEDTKPVRPWTDVGPGGYVLW